MTSPFTIDVPFLGGLTDRQKDAFKATADRWSQAIVGDLPGVLVSGEIIDDVLILAQAAEIDGPRGILGQVSPTHMRPANAGNARFIPAKGTMQFDTADLEEMEQNGRLNDVITHEMGHVLGIGTIWTVRSCSCAILLQPAFIGQNAMAEYGRLRGGGSGPTAVPVENTAGPGTRDAHWRQTIFFNELMSGFIAEIGNPLSRMTVGSLQDLGYKVNIDAAEAYTQPDMRALAEGGLLIARAATIERGIMLPQIPLMLPEDSLQ